MFAYMAYIGWRFKCWCSVIFQQLTLTLIRSPDAYNSRWSATFTFYVLLTSVAFMNWARGSPLDKQRSLGDKLFWPGSMCSMFTLTPSPVETGCLLTMKRCNHELHGGVFAGAVASQRVRFQILLCGVCLFSPCRREFSPCSLAYSHMTKTAQVNLLP